MHKFITSGDDVHVSGTCSLIELKLNLFKQPESNRFIEGAYIELESISESFETFSENDRTTKSEAYKAAVEFYENEGGNVVFPLVKNNEIEYYLPRKIKITLNTKESGMENSVHLCPYDKKITINTYMDKNNYARIYNAVFENQCELNYEITLQHAHPSREMDVGIRKCCVIHVCGIDEQLSYVSHTPDALKGTSNNA